MCWGTIQAQRSPFGGMGRFEPCGASDGREGRLTSVAGMQRGYSMTFIVASSYINGEGEQLRSWGLIIYEWRFSCAQRRGTSGAGQSSSSAFGDQARWNLKMIVGDQPWVWRPNLRWPYRWSWLSATRVSRDESQ